MAQTENSIVRAYVTFSDWLETADIPRDVAGALAVLFEYAAEQQRLTGEYERALRAMSGV